MSKKNNIYIYIISKKKKNNKKLEIILKDFQIITKIIRYYN